MTYTIDELIGLSLANVLPKARASVPQVLKFIAQTESDDAGRVDLYIWVVSSDHLPDPDERRVEQIVLEGLSGGQFNFMGVTPYFFFQTQAEREKAGFTA